MAAIRITEQNLLTVLIRGSWALLALLALVGLLTMSGRFALSVLAGGLLAIANFCWLRNILQRILQTQPDSATRYALLRYLLRLALLGAAVFALLRTGIDVAGLLLGLSVLVINIMGLAIYYVLARKGE